MEDTALRLPIGADTFMMASMRTIYALALDTLLVLVFAVTGRASHQEALDIAGVAMTAWPFLSALLMGWIIVALLGWAPASLKTGGLLWLVTLVGGMGLRVASGGTTAVAFITVAGVSLALFLVGWRVIAALLRRREG